MTPKQAAELLEVFATGQFVRMDELTLARSIIAKEQTKETRKKRETVKKPSTGVTTFGKEVIKND